MKNRDGYKSRKGKAEKKQQGASFVKFVIHTHQGGYVMNNENNIIWIDNANRIFAFHPIENGIMITKNINYFWEYVCGLTELGFRVM